MKKTFAVLQRRLSLTPLPPVVPPVSWLHNELRVALVGREVDLSYTYDHLGEESDVLQQLANGTHPFCEVMRGTHTHTHTHTHWHPFCEVMRHTRASLLGGNGEPT